MARLTEENVKAKIQITVRDDGKADLDVTRPDKGSHRSGLTLADAICQAAAVMAEEAE